MKIIGIILVIGSCYLFGYQYICLKKETISSMKHLSLELSEMSNYIGFQLEEIPDIIRRISSTVSCAQDNLFKRFYNLQNKQPELPFSDLWTSSARSFCQDKHIPEQVLNQLISLGNLLGTSDYESEQKRLETVKKSIDNAIKTAENDSQKTEKMLRSLSVIVGIFIVILLL